MGRYYWGDIEGKFWFGVQPTADLLEFGHAERDSTRLNVVVPYKRLTAIAKQVKTWKADFRKHGISFTDFMARLALSEAGVRRPTDTDKANWKTMCREASLISLGEQIVKRLKSKKEHLSIEGEY